MPIIVPIEENHEGIAGLTDAKFRAPDYSGSGLEALGAGLTKVGEGGAQFAAALDRIPDGSIQVRLAQAVRSNTANGHGLRASPSGPDIPIFCIRGHIDDASDGMR
ncbi:MAG TPA: hypothetical protein VK980_13860 [Sphingomonas sp.]|nr:hypothetical protein [Sphingomonas sp.]